jgi:putative ABC transport system permease protein
MIRLAWRYLWAQPLTALLNLLLMTLGLGAVSLVVLVSEQLDAGLRRDLAGVDLVVGAKGSPMQLILASVFHLDTPTGNIPAETLATLRSHPLVSQAVPLALGDSLRGFRVVGTDHGFLRLYDARLARGQAWQRPMQAVLGAEVARRTGLDLGAEFAGSHGLGEGGASHDDHHYTVVGVLAPTGGAIDRLVLTDVASVWALHEDHAAPGAESHAPEVTAVLLGYRSPLAAVSLPRWVNAQDALQAASPALETARLMRMVGVGEEVLRGFGWVLMAAAALSVGVALLHAVRARQADLAMLRMLGAPPRRVGLLVVAEALCLALLGAVLGLVLGHVAVEALGQALAARQSVRLTGVWFSPAELQVLGLALVAAALAALWPAWRAYRLDVTQLLQAPR